MNELSVKESQICSNERARSSEQGEKPLHISYRLFSAKPINLRSTPHAADWISGGSLHDQNTSVVGGIRRCAAHFDLAAFGSCDRPETLRVSEVMAASH